MNIYGTAIEVRGIVHRATKFEGTKNFVVMPACRGELSLHDFQAGSDREITCRVCLAS